MRSSRTTCDRLMQFDADEKVPEVIWMQLRCLFFGSQPEMQTEQVAADLHSGTDAWTIEIEKSYLLLLKRVFHHPFLVK